MAITMEELERKAKRYDEVLAMAQECVTYIPDEAVKKYMLNMFPELKESRDEEIRKLLIKLFKSNTNEKFYDVSTQEIVAWLEKQEMSYTKRDVEDAYIEGVVSTKNELEKQGEPSLKAEQSDMQILNMWREEDEHRAKDTIYFLDTAKKHYASTVELDACIDWLKSLKDKVQSQPKQDWSEEDEKMLDDAIGAVGAADYYTYDDKQEIENWLKAIKQRVGWKPSEEQMKALALALHDVHGMSYKKHLFSLKQQLKQLWVKDGTA